MSPEKRKALAAKMVAAVKLHTTRALDARLGPLEKRLLDLENAGGRETATLRKRIADLESQLDLFQPDDRGESVEAVLAAERLK
jgi:hypothetical protein